MRRQCTHCRTLDNPTDRWCYLRSRPVHSAHRQRIILQFKVTRFNCYYLSAVTSSRIASHYLETHAVYFARILRVAINISIYLLVYFSALDCASIASSIKHTRARPTLLTKLVRLPLPLVSSPVRSEHSASIDKCVLSTVLSFGNHHHYLTLEHRTFLYGA